MGLDINSVIMNGFKPIFVDIDLDTLSMSTEQVIKKISKKLLAVLLMHKDLMDYQINC